MSLELAQVAHKDGVQDEDVQVQESCGKGAWSARSRGAKREESARPVNEIMSKNDEKKQKKNRKK